MGLLNSTILDVVIGLAFVYLLLALICTTINEWIAGWLGIRSKTLAKAIKQMLDQQPGSGNATLSFLEQFYVHPLITGMVPPGSKPGGSHPSYLPSRTFATAVVDITTPNKAGMITFADLDAGIKALPNGDVKAALLALIQNANNDLNQAKKNIEQWFDDTMDRASGWFKRRIQLVTIVIAIFLTGLTNADTVRITHILWKSPTLRATLVEKAKGRIESPQSVAEYKDKNSPLKPTAKLTKDDMDKLQMVLGWAGENPNDPGSWPQRLIGWILTIVALSLGAPFWFDLLTKLMNIRNAGQKPQKTDGQPAK